MPGPGWRGEQRLQLRADAVARADVIADVGPVEAGDDQPVLGDAELGEDVGAGARVGGRGQRQPRHVAMGVEQRPQQAIVGAEVVAPFADAMRLVDRDQRQRACARPARGSPRSSPARARRRAGRARRRGSAAIVCLAVARRPRSARRRGSRSPRRERIWSCISAISGEMTSAVPVARQRRQLVAERLARTRSASPPACAGPPSPGRPPAPARRGNASKPKMRLEDVSLSAGTWSARAAKLFRRFALLPARARPPGAPTARRRARRARAARRGCRARRPGPRRARRSGRRRPRSTGGGR